MIVEDARPLTVIRPDDLVVLTFRFEGLELHTPTAGESAQLARVGPPAGPPLIIVEFQPQSFAEEAFFEDAPGFPPPPAKPGDPPPPQDAGLPAPGLVVVSFSGLSRLVFVVPPSVTTIDYSLQGILRICGLCEQSTAHLDPMPAEPQPGDAAPAGRQRGPACATSRPATYDVNRAASMPSGRAGGWRRRRLSGVAGARHTGWGCSTMCGLANRTRTRP